MDVPLHILQSHYIIYLFIMYVIIAVYFNLHQYPILVLCRNIYSIDKDFLSIRRGLHNLKNIWLKIKVERLSHISRLVLYWKNLSSNVQGVRYFRVKVTYIDAETLAETIG